MNKKSFNWRLSLVFKFFGWFVIFLCSFLYFSVCNDCHIDHQHMTLFFDILISVILSILMILKDIIKIIKS